MTLRPCHRNPGTQYQKIPPISTSGGISRNASPVTKLTKEEAEARYTPAVVVPRVGHLRLIVERVEQGAVGQVCRPDHGRRLDQVPAAHAGEAEADHLRRQGEHDREPGAPVNAVLLAVSTRRRKPFKGRVRSLSALQSSSSSTLTFISQRPKILDKKRTVAIGVCDVGHDGD
jgi:hypothetical protein